MKKQVITIEREVPDDTDDLAYADRLHGYYNPPNSAAPEGYATISVVSEPIPEAKPLKVLQVGYTPGAVLMHDEWLVQFVKRALKREIRLQHPTTGGSFHVEVIPQ